MRAWSIGLLLLVILLFSYEHANAALVCYSENYYPSVFKLVETENSIEAHLGGVYADHIGDSVYTEENYKAIPILRWQQGKGWRYVGKKTSYPHGSTCHITIPKWPTELPKPGEIIEESASSCAVAGDTVWFGVNFYNGEGYTGHGGIGHYERQSNRLEVRRIPELRDYPIDKAVWDGENIWAATASNYECLGTPPALGLIKYNWNTKALTIYKGTNTGPCGFIIHDLLWAQGFLWVATDVGISRWDSKNDKWTHYLPDQKSPYHVKEGSCGTFYRNILTLLPKDQSWFDETRSYYQIFYENLKEFRPDFIKLYESRKHEQDPTDSSNHR